MILYHNDHLGTPQKLTASNGAVVWSAKYEGFGKAAVEVETVENNLRFPGQYYDEETGLHYNWWRYYEPDTGRYLRVDPSHSMLSEQNFSYLLREPQELNNFSYVSNNSINIIDPLGLMGAGPKAIFIAPSPTPCDPGKYCKDMHAKKFKSCKTKGLGTPGCLYQCEIWLKECLYWSTAKVTDNSEGCCEYTGTECEEECEEEE